LYTPDFDNTGHGIAIDLWCQRPYLVALRTFIDGTGPSINGTETSCQPCKRRAILRAVSRLPARNSTQPPIIEILEIANSVGGPE